MTMEMNMLIKYDLHNKTVRIEREGKTLLLFSRVPNPDILAYELQRYLDGAALVRRQTRGKPSRGGGGSRQEAVVTNDETKLYRYGDLVVFDKPHPYYWSRRAMRVYSESYDVEYRVLPSGRRSKRPTRVRYVYIELPSGCGVRVEAAYLRPAKVRSRKKYEAERARWINERRVASRWVNGFGA